MLQGDAGLAALTDGAAWLGVSVIILATAIANQAQLLTQDDQLLPLNGVVAGAAVQRFELT